MILLLLAAGCPGEDDTNETFVTGASNPTQGTTGSADDTAEDSGTSAGPGGDPTTTPSTTDPSAGPSTTDPTADPTTDTTAECTVPPPGADTGAETVTVDPANIIDDFEDGDGAVTDQGGRAGYWYTYDDGTSTVCPEGDFLPVAGGPNGSVNAASFSATTPFTEWGAGLGVDINSVGGVRDVYDASAYTGVVFQIRSTVASARFSIPIPVTVGTANGGTCTETCDDNFGFNLTGLTTSWTQVQVPFAELAQAGWGTEVEAFDATQILGLQWQVANGAPFELSLDSVAFY